MNPAPPVTRILEFLMVIVCFLFGAFCCGNVLPSNRFTVESGYCRIVLSGGCRIVLSGDRFIVEPFYRGIGGMWNRENVEAPFCCGIVLSWDRRTVESVNDPTI